LPKTAALKSLKAWTIFGQYFFPIDDFLMDLNPAGPNGFEDRAQIKIRVYFFFGGGSLGGGNICQYCSRN
jgi:hypothetical protein